MKSRPGTYAILFRSARTGRVIVGRWGELLVERGYYVYVGSAFGPGGLAARVQRHCRQTKTVHWHIDYLRAWLDPIRVWYSYDARRLEHRWAKTINIFDNANTVSGFGSSDCKCPGHLFHTDRLRNFLRLDAALSGELHALTVTAKHEH